MISGKERRNSLLLVTLFAVILSVFAMHSLSAHESTHREHAAVPSLLTDETGLERDHTGSMRNVGLTQPGSLDGPRPDHEVGSGDLCLAFLYLVTALVTLTMLRGLSRRILYAVPRRRGPRPVALGRSPDPPCLHRLSILRC